eukprot:403373535
MNSPNKPGIFGHQSSLLKTPVKHDSTKNVYQNQHSLGGHFIQIQEELPVDNGSKNIIAWNKQQTQKQKNQKQLKIQLLNLDNEIQRQAPIQRYDTTSHALQKKGKSDQQINGASNSINQISEEAEEKSSNQGKIMSKRGANLSFKDDLNNSSVDLLKSPKTNKKALELADQLPWWQKCLRMCRRGKQHKLNHDNEDQYSEGESDTEFETPYSKLKFQEQQDRVKYLWHRAFLKAKGAAHILAKFGELNKKIYLYGAARKGEEHEDPQTVMIRNENPTYMIVMDTLMDLIFFTDLVLSFFSAYEDKKVGIEVRHKQIAIAYFKSWFVLDLLSCVPIQLMELQLESETQSSGGKKSQTSSVKLLRLTRLPRLYRLIRIIRLFKMLRLFKQQSSMKRLFDSIKMNAGIVRMISVTITVFFLVHLVGCFWFLSAKLDDFNPDTWVVRLGYMDVEPSGQYLASIYWALQTLTTVGFGDINAKTISEKIIAILWMIFGVGFYSFTIGNLSQIIASIDTQSAILSQKLSILSEFAKRTDLPTDVMFRIRRHLENNNKHQNNLEEQEKLLNDLPAALRSEVVKHTHGEIIQKINFFKEKDPDFLWAILPALRPIKLMPTDVLYTQGDHSDEIYFIKKGRIKLYIDVNENNPDAQEPLNIAFIAYVEGSYFGDSDIFFQDENKGRDSTAVADTECHLLVLSRKDLMALGDDFQEMSKEIRDIARERKSNHQDLIQETVTEHVHSSVQQNVKHLVMDGAYNSGINVGIINNNFSNNDKNGDSLNVLRAPQTGINPGDDRTSKSRIQSLNRIDKTTSNNQDMNNGGSGGQKPTNMFSDALLNLNVLAPSVNQSTIDPSLPKNLQEKLAQKENIVQIQKTALDTKQKHFREEYNETLVNFQNNMNFLSIHADEIQNMFVKYQGERQAIMGAMNLMKDQAQTLKQNSEFLKSSLDMIVENMSN